MTAEGFEILLADDMEKATVPFEPQVARRRAAAWNIAVIAALNITILRGSVDRFMGLLGSYTQPCKKRSQLFINKPVRGSKFRRKSLPQEDRHRNISREHTNVPVYAETTGDSRWYETNKFVYLTTTSCCRRFYRRSGSTSACRTSWPTWS